MRGNVQSFLNSIPDPSKMTPEEQLAMGLNANPVMGLLGATAFHGSPYKFGIVHNRITTQAEGFSLIDKQEKKFI
jgi:hypothetical protein